MQGDFANITKTVNAAAPSPLSVLLFLRIMLMVVDGYLNVFYSISAQCLSTIFILMLRLIPFPHSPQCLLHFAMMHKVSTSDVGMK